jgi:hypothetical protein
MRHYDKWARLFHGHSLDECLESIRDDADTARTAGDERDLAY